MSISFTRKYRIANYRSEWPLPSITCSVDPSGFYFGSTGDKEAATPAMDYPGLFVSIRGSQRKYQRINTRRTPIDMALSWCHHMETLSALLAHGHRWIPLTKGNNEELWCLIVPEQAIEETVEILFTATRPSMNTTRPSMNTTRPSMNTTRPSMNTTRPSMNTTRPSMNTTRPSMNTTRPSMNTTRPSMNTTRQGMNRVIIGSGSKLSSVRYHVITWTTITCFQPESGNILIFCQENAFEIAWKCRQFCPFREVSKFVSILWRLILASKKPFLPTTRICWWFQSAI